MSSGGNSSVPWPVWAIVSILIALIGAYATLKANKPNSTPTFVRQWKQIYLPKT
jgi:hypothetical protein